MPQLSRSATIPGDVVLRAIAIVMIVFNHSHEDAPFWNWKGGLTILLMLMGFNLARFGFKNADPASARRAIGDLLWRMFVPAFIFTLIYLSVHVVVYRHVYWAELFFVANWITPYHPQVFPVWYSQVMLQLLAAIYLLFCIPAVARGFLRLPLEGMLALFAAGIALNLLMPFVWDTRYLWYQVPHNYVWNIALGGLVYFLAFEPNGVRLPKLMAIAGVVLGAAVGYGSGKIEFYMLIAGGIFLVTVRQMRLPWMLSQTLVVISSATYAIFLMHVMWIKVFLVTYPRIFGPGPWPDVAFHTMFVFALTMSIGCWLVFKSFVRALQSLPIALPRLGVGRA